MSVDVRSPLHTTPNYSMHSNLGLCTSRRSRVSSERDWHTITYVMVCPRLCTQWWYMMAVPQHICAIQSNSVELRRGDLMAKRRSAPQAKYFCAAARRTKDGKISGARTRNFGVLRRRAAAVGRDGDLAGTEVSAIEHVRVTAKPRGAWISLLQPIFAHVFAFESCRTAG